MKDTPRAPAGPASPPPPASAPVSPPLHAVSPPPPASGPAAPARRVRPGTVLRLALLVLFFTAAPTVGDIGSCGQAPDEMDPVKFYTAKQQLDCDRCTTCGLLSEACTRACEPALEQTDFPRDCRPLVHDGEVCLNALQASGCDDYRQYMSDFQPTIPTECNFCPPCDDGGVPDGSPPDLPRCD